MGLLEFSTKQTPAPLLLDPPIDSIVDAPNKNRYFWNDVI
jgi:hypothetical protein